MWSSQYPVPSQNALWVSLATGYRSTGLSSDLLDESSQHSTDLGNALQQACDLVSHDAGIPGQKQLGLQFIR